MISFLERKFFSAIILFGIVVFPFSVSAVSVAPEGFFDSEKSEGNVLSVGTLDFSLASDGDFSGAVSETESAKRDIEVKKMGSLGFQYKVKADNFSGDLCNKLKLRVRLEGESVPLYNGDLNKFSHKIGIFSDPEKLEFEVGLQDSASGWEGKTCAFDLVFDGWQEDFANFGEGGFTDTEKIANSVVSVKDIVINEIFPDPNGADNSDKAHSEFIELYNNTNLSKNVGGWRIYIGESDFIEINNDTTDGAGVNIGAKGFLVVYLSKKWSGSVLNNSSDSVYLYKGLKSSSDLVDSYNYSGAQEDKSFTRQPSGTGNWILAMPSPGS